MRFLNNDPKNKKPQNNKPQNSDDGRQGRRIVFLMVAALAAIGLNTNFRELCRSGAKPMLHGFIISLLVVLVAIAVEYAIGVAPTGTLV